MVIIINNPLQLVLDKIESVTHIQCDAVLIPDELARGNIAYVSEDDKGEPVICLNSSAPYDRLLAALVETAAGIASEHMNMTQSEIYKEINKEIQKQQESEAAENE